jgi:hypothetical protein
MKKFLTIIMVLTLSLILAAGCTQPAAPPATPVPTTVVTTIAPTTEATPVPTTIASSKPEPVQTLPSIWGVDVQVNSNGEAIDPQVILTFRGGKGLNLIPEIDIRVTRSDGVVEEAKMKQPLYVGQTVSLPGTRQNNDRAEVWAITPQGDRVKIYDDYVPFRQYH